MGCKQKLHKQFIGPVFHGMAIPGLSVFLPLGLEKLVGAALGHVAEGNTLRAGRAK